MGFDDGQIVLNSDNGTYFPGQMLYGRLEFNLDKVKQFRGIYADIRGRCKVHWTTNHTRKVNDRMESYTVTHESHEEYMNVTIYLIGSKSGEHTLHPGRHVFPFECQIPPHCPSSFEGSVGNIRYSVKVTVDRAFKLDQTKLAAFRVEAPVDLNTNPYCKEPVVMEFEQTFCCWCMNSGLAETLVKLPAGGFCPKQIMPIEVACKNNSSVEIDTIKFSIERTLTFEAEHEPDRRSEESEIAALKKGPIPENTTRNWTAEMEVPDMDVPNLKNCRFINIDYRFKVEISTSGCHTDETESRPLFIGTIALGSLQYPPNSNFESVQNTHGVSQYPAPPITNQPLFNSNGAPYPGANPPYPGANPPYPGANPPYPGANPPYPVNNPTMGFNVSENPQLPTVTPISGPMPYPASPNVSAVSPYPNSAGGNPPIVTAQHVNSNAPYPNSGRSSPYNTIGNPNIGTHQSYPGQNTGSLPYPNSPNIGANPPYPTSPNVGANPPYPTSSNDGSNTPYSPQNTGSNFPTTNYSPSSSPYTPGKPSVTSVTGLKTGNIGFPYNDSKESAPLLPPGAMPLPPSPYASASAPPPSTPDVEDNKPTENGPPYPQ